MGYGKFKHPSLLANNFKPPFIKKKKIDNPPPSLTPPSPNTFLTVPKLFTMYSALFP